MGVPRSWHPIFFAFLRCAHMGVPRSWYPIIFVARTGGGGCKRKKRVQVTCIWESRDHGTLYFFCLFALRAYGSPALMVPYNFCCAHGRVDVKEKEMRSGHVPYGVVLRSSINAFYTISGGFQKIKFWKSDSERQNVPARLANMVKGRRTATIIYQVRD